MIGTYDSNYNECSPSVGQIVYPASVCHELRGTPEQIEVSDKPWGANMSHDPLLLGWLGTTNDVRYEAMGIYRITKIAPDRLKDNIAHVTLRRVSAKEFRDIAAGIALAAMGE